MIRSFAVVVGVVCFASIAYADGEACISSYEKAQVLRRAARLVEAREHLVACGASRCPTATTTDCIPWLREVEAALPTVVIGARVEGIGDVVDVQVTVDGRALPMPLDGKAFPLDPGMHAFRFERPGSTPVLENVLVREGEKNRLVSVTLLATVVAPAVVRAEPQPPPRQEEQPRRKTSGSMIGPLLLGITGIATLAAGTVLDAHGFTQAEALKSCSPSCSTSQRDSARTELVVGDVLLTTGIVTTAAAVVWFFLTREAKPFTF